MFKPEDLKDMDLTTLRKMAKKIDSPQLRKLYREQLKQDGFKEGIDELAKEVENLFKHSEDTPDE